MKLVVIPKTTTRIDEYIKIGANALIFGLKNYCTNFDVALTIEEIKEYCQKYPEIEIFVSVNKNFFNKELEGLKEIVKELDKLPIKGVLFYDLAILNMKIELGLTLDLVWNQTHMVTNYNTCNYYYSKGVNYGILAQEITLEEMIEIKNKTKMTMMPMILAYPCMSHSRRKLLSNFLKVNKTAREDKIYYLKEREKEYFIKENESGASIYENRIVNGAPVTLSLVKNDFQYAILNAENMTDDIFLKVLALYKELIETQNEILIKKIKDLIGEYTGFFYQKTIYKVKKDEK